MRFPLSLRTQHVRSRCLRTITIAITCTVAADIGRRASASQGASAVHVAWVRPVASCLRRVTQARRPARDELGCVGRPALPEIPIDVSVEELPGVVKSLGSYGPLYFYCVCVLSIVIMAPITPFLLTAGYLFGFPMGVGIMMLAVCSSAGVGFLLSRTLLRQRLQARVSRDKRLQNMKLAVERETFKIIALLRLSPLLPFAATNYALGLSSVAFLDYMFATAAGYAPWTVVSVYVSSIARDVLEGELDAPWYVYGAGILFTLCVLKLISDIANDAVSRAAAGGDAASQSSPSARAVDIPSSQ